MNMDKYIMFKAVINRYDYITISTLKNDYNVDGGEAEEMLTNAIQEGMVEPYPVDGTHYRVIK